MVLFDIIILVVILFGAIIGFKRGFTKQLISFVGLFVIIILAFYFKNYISVFMYENLPFFPFNGFLKGVTVLNIVLYEFIAFFLVLAVLGIILKVLLFASGVFETMLNFTIVLGIPSKILGALVGALESYVMVFIVLYLLSLPVFNATYLDNYKTKDRILNDTPVLSGYVDKSLKVFDEFALLKDSYAGDSDANEFNLQTLDLFLKYKVVTIKSIDLLVAKHKIQINNIDSVLNNYR